MMPPAQTALFARQPGSVEAPAVDLRERVVPNFAYTSTPDAPVSVADRVAEAGPVSVAPRVTEPFVAAPEPTFLGRPPVEPAAQPGFFGRVAHMPVAAPAELRERVVPNFTEEDYQVEVAHQEVETNSATEPAVEDAIAKLMKDCEVLQKGHQEQSQTMEEQRQWLNEDSDAEDHPEEQHSEAQMQEVVQIYEEPCAERQSGEVQAQQQPDIINDNILGESPERFIAPVAYGQDQQAYDSYSGLCLSWKMANGKHPMVQDDETEYVMDCLKAINTSVGTYGIEELAIAEGLCKAGECENMDPVKIVRQVLEQILQSKSRSGNDDIFVQQGAAFSSGYKKKIPLHVFIANAPMTSAAMDAAAGKDPTMTVLWDWQVKLQGYKQEDE